ncbi:MAG: hypothetical protein ACI80S_000672 [Pseudohongiellaceae bacterium]|jgi:hypothetical protein
MMPQNLYSMLSLIQAAPLSCIISIETIKVFFIEYIRVHYFMLTLVSIVAVGASAMVNSSTSPSNNCVGSKLSCSLNKSSAIKTELVKKLPSVISKINIYIHPIFDESSNKENNALFRLANRLHIDTDSRVISNDLLFAEGDRLSHQKLLESERILRSRRYLNNVKVSNKELADGSTEVDIDVNEVWTLFPTLSYSRSGGNTEYSFGVKDSNFLGSGRSINLFREQNADRTGDSFEFQDTNTGWYQTNASLTYTNNDDGSKQKFALIKPFFSLSTNTAGGFSYEKFDRAESVYNEGDKIDRYSFLSEHQHIFYGNKFNVSNTVDVHRWKIGFSKQMDTFKRLAKAPNIIALPTNRDFNISWFEYQYIRNDFVKSYNVQQINRVEDINFGLQTTVRIGHVNSTIKTYDNSLELGFKLDRGYRLKDRHLLFTNLSISGFHKDDVISNGLAKVQIQYHWYNFSRGQLFIDLEGARGQHLFADQYLYLGGNNGLRGYPDFYQEGDRRYLFSLEQRFYGQKEWLSLFYLGYAFFYDQGRAWGNSLVTQAEDEELRDVGFGLRFSGTRVGGQNQGNSNVLHFDIAQPLDANAETSDLQWVLKVKSSF